MNIYTKIVEKSKLNKKQLAVLIDPDEYSEKYLTKTIEESVKSNVDYFFIGGSLIVDDYLEICIKAIKQRCSIPIVLFPGNYYQISKNADAILFLSLISGRNSEYLIGQHVIAAPYLKESGIEIISTGYILIDSGKPTTVQNISQTFPIPANKHKIASCTAMAGEMLGLSIIYLDGGSGGEHPIPNNMVAEVKKSIKIPLIVGGGIRTPQNAYDLCSAGADVIVIGSIVEKNPSIISEFANLIHNY